MYYRNPGKIVLVGRVVEGEVRFSLRSRKFVLPPLLEKALVGIDGYGGGHSHACGGGIKKGDFPKFIENFKALLE